MPTLNFFMDAMRTMAQPLKAVVKIKLWPCRNPGAAWQHDRTASRPRLAAATSARGGVQAYSTLLVHSNALRAGDGSRSALLSRCGAKVALSKCAPAIVKFACPFSHALA